MRAKFAGAVANVTNLSKAIETGLDVDVERWSQDQVRFVSEAQRAARQALYFVRLLEVNSDAGMCAHVQTSVAKTLAGVPSVPAALRCRAGGDCLYTGAKEEFKVLETRWNELKRDCDDASEFSALEPLERNLAAFLRASAPSTLGIRLTYVRIPAIARAVRQHLAFLIGLALALAVLFGVEPVFSLFRNRPLYGGLALFFAVLPGVVLLLAGDWLRRRWTPPWDVGGKVVRRIFPTLIEPAPWIPWHPRGHRLTRSIYLGLGLKVLLYLLIWVFFGGVVQVFVSAFQFDTVLLTVYLIAVVLAGVAFVGAAIDFADLHSQAPVRGILMSGVFVFGLAVWLTDDPNWLLVVPIVWALLVLPWVWRMRQLRVTPVVLVIAGGIAVTLSSTTNRLEADRWRNNSGSSRFAAIDPSEWPAGGDSGAPIVVMAASGGGSRAAIMVAHTLQRLREEHAPIAENLQAISAVSGGSLATASYVARQLRANGRDTVDLPACGASLADAMGQDFLYPTMWSVLLGEGRAQGIQRAWQACPVGLGELRVSRLGEIWKSRNVRARGTAPPFAVPIFNSVTLDRHAVVITPFAGSFFRQPLDTFARAPLIAAAAVAAGGPSNAWVYYRSGIYHLADIGPRIDPRLSEAVRASANFPFGFPLVEVSSSEPLWYSPRAPEREPETPKVVRLTDGGALSNSGLWPLLPLLLNKQHDIGRRGVLLIIVDASRMPRIGATDRQRGLLQTILDKAPKSERSNYQMLGQLDQAYGDCFAFVQIAIDPLAKNNIYTTWALDGGSRALLDTLFEESWQRVSGELNTAFESLRACKGASRSTRVKRVPVD